QPALLVDDGQRGAVVLPEDLDGRPPVVVRGQAHELAVHDVGDAQGQRGEQDLPDPKVVDQPAVGLGDVNGSGRLAGAAVGPDVVEDVADGPLPADGDVVGGHQPADGPLGVAEEGPGDVALLRGQQGEEPPGLVAGQLGEQGRAVVGGHLVEQ